MRRTTFTHTKCDFILKLLKFYTSVKYYQKMAQMSDINAFTLFYSDSKIIAMHKLLMCKIFGLKNQSCELLTNLMSPKNGLKFYRNHG